VDRPLPLAYHPEVDVSPLLDATLTTRFQNGLGVLRWIVELGRINIMTEVSIQTKDVWSAFDRSCQCFCDNQGVINNTTSPESVLGKKHN